MSDFARQQSDFQRGILSGDDKVLAEILDSPKEKREVLFGVYKYAYGSRLVDALRNDHKLLHSYVGDEMFDEIGQAYVAANPSQHPNLRWFSQGLPDFLKTPPYGEYPILSDLAALERRSTTRSTPGMRRWCSLPIWRALRPKPGMTSDSKRTPVHAGSTSRPMSRPFGFRSRARRCRRMRYLWSNRCVC